MDIVQASRSARRDHSTIDHSTIGHSTVECPSLVGASDDSGQAAALVVGLVAVLAVIVVAIGIFGVHVSDLARARTAADAAALAGAAAGSEAAAQAAIDNGARLDSFDAAVSQLGTDVIVRVSVGTASATARAAIGHAPLPTLARDGADRYSG